MSLKYFSRLTGDMMFVEKNNKFIGVKIRHDGEAWRPFTYDKNKNDKIIRDLQEADETDDSKYYHHVIETILEKRQID